MKVSELIEILKDCDQEKEILIPIDETYLGNIDCVSCRGIYYEICSKVKY
mgnify:CR=1 FL=1